MIVEAYIGSVQIHRTEGIALSGFSWAPIPREQRTPRPTAHGEIDATRYYAGSLFELEGYVRGRTAKESHERFDSLRRSVQLGANPVLLRFRRDPALGLEQAYVRAASPVEYQLRGGSNLIRWSLQLLAADPRVYSSTVSTVSYDPTADEPDVGVTFPLAFPLMFGAVSGDNLVAINGGSADTPPTFVIRGPATNPIIDNDTTGLAIVTQNLALLEGDELHIDVANRRALLGGETNRPDLISPTRTSWFQLVPGENLLRLRGLGFANGETHLTASWRDARL